MGIYYLDVGQYSFRSHGGTFGTAARAIQPGTPYHAYFACHSQTLASAEPAGSEWHPPMPSTQLEQLQAVFGFDDEDLANNRSGTMSFDQYPLGGLAGRLVFIVGFITVGIVWMCLDGQFED
jgi:hypothetical protein